MSEYIKKEDMEKILYSTNNAVRIGELFTELPTYSFPNSAENKGEWIYDKNIDNWRCSKCGQTPPPTGYVGKADFMATHFKFCPNCGADMRGAT